MSSPKTQIQSFEKRSGWKTCCICTSSPEQSSKCSSWQCPRRVMRMVMTTDLARFENQTSCCFRSKMPVSLWFTCDLSLHLLKFQRESMSIWIPRSRERTKSISIPRFKVNTDVNSNIISASPSIVNIVSISIKTKTEITVLRIRLIG